MQHTTCGPQALPTAVRELGWESHSAVLTNPLSPGNHPHVSVALVAFFPYKRNHTERRTSEADLFHSADTFKIHPGGSACPQFPPLYGRIEAYPQGCTRPPAGGHAVSSCWWSRRNISGPPASQDRLWREPKVSLRGGSHLGAGLLGHLLSALGSLRRCRVPQRLQALSFPTGHEGPDCFAFVTGAWRSFPSSFIFTTLGLEFCLIRV